MANHKYLLLLLIILGIIIIPCCYGADNTSDAHDIYFNGDVLNDSGEGLPDNPYKTLREARLLDNSVIHISNGEYDFSPEESHSNLTFIGEDASKTIINGNGKRLYVHDNLVLANITISNLTIFKQSTITASNVIFTNNNVGNSYGGAIFGYDFLYDVYLNNCSFINNHAFLGGAIYCAGAGLEINNCCFINNSARCYGGAVAYSCLLNLNNNAHVSVKHSVFVNDSSLDDAGGAVYLEDASFTGVDLNVSECYSNFGGAFTFLSSDVNLSNIYAYKNRVKYDGGVIYQYYGNLSLDNSVFLSNRACNAGVLFAGNVGCFCMVNNSFISNAADFAGAVYGLLNKNVSVSGNVYVNNSAFLYNDYYKQDNLTLVFSQSNYTLFNGVFNSSDLPSYYSSVEEGFVSPVKNQGNGGNCWAFATLGALESSILKCGWDLDLSEENMKNLASSYSRYGWQMKTNEGGYDDMALGYLVSWLGPILEKDDRYNDLSMLSPNLDSILHVQNVRYLTRSSVYDNDEIKRAIMDCGAVYAGIYMVPYYCSEVGAYVQYYNGFDFNNHAVVLVGWDDDFYIPDAPGRGAWIVKNSWGDSWGNNGYFYLSYYDTSCPKINSSGAVFAFILNDTLKYDKNYQYDISKTDYFFNTLSTAWYKNIFQATDNEYLTAVSTYFEKNTQWELNIKINNNLKQTQKGNSKPGYETIQLNNPIPLKKGDKFEIIFKITVKGDVGVPISEIISLNNYFYDKNISYISYDGKNWKDLYNLTWTYPEHTYNSQVACIKAFTIKNEINTTITLTIENRTQQTGILKINLKNQWGQPVNNADITIKTPEHTYTTQVINGIAIQKINLQNTNITITFNKTGYKTITEKYQIKNPLIKTNITLNITNKNNPVNITITVTDENKNPVKEGNIILTINDENYTLKITNTTAKLENINITPGKTNITAYYTDNLKYENTQTTMEIEILKIKTNITLNITKTESNNPINLTVTVTDENNTPVSSGIVIFTIEENNYYMEVINGTANLEYTFSKIGQHQININYYDQYRYDTSSYNQTINVTKTKVNMTLTTKIQESDATLTITIPNATKGFEIQLTINNKTYNYISTEKTVISEIKNLENKTYNYTIQLISPIYEANNITGQFTITHKKTQLTTPQTTICYDGGIKVTLKDTANNPLPNRDIYLTVLGTTHKQRTNQNGTATFKLKLKESVYQVTINFIGDDEYLKSKTSTIITVKPSITIPSYEYAANANLNATLYGYDGNPIINQTIPVTYNGITQNLTTDNIGQIHLDLGLDFGVQNIKITNPITNETLDRYIVIIDRITENNPLTAYYGSKTIFKIRICDDYGQYRENLTVQFTINTKQYNITTDSEGYASLKLKLKPGKYTINIQYKNCTANNTIKIKPLIITKNKKIKHKKTITFKAKLINKKRKPQKNKKITFKFKGKTYKIKTNKKGIAILKINKKYKKGKYTIITKYKKQKVKNKIIIK